MRNPAKQAMARIAYAVLLAAGLAVFAPVAAGAPALMSSEWAVQACQQWNKQPALTAELADKWMKNDKGRGFKTLQIFRSDCTESPRVELRISLKDGKAQCVYGGKLQNAQPDLEADYQMWAETARWKEMGAGEYGPMRAMLFGRLNFNGPTGEAMGHMGPFGEFLLLAGKVESETSACPK